MDDAKKINKSHFMEEMDRHKGETKQVIVTQKDVGQIKNIYCRLWVQRDLAEALDINHSTLNRMVSGRNACRQSYLERLAEIWGNGLRWQWLCGDDDEPRTKDDLIDEEKALAWENEKHKRSMAFRFEDFMTDVGYTISYDKDYFYVTDEDNVFVMKEDQFKAFREAIYDATYLTASTFLASPFRKIKRL